MSLKRQILRLAYDAKEASVYLATLSRSEKDKVLRDMAKALRRNKKFIIKANSRDLNFASKEKISKAMVDRLTLDNKRIEDMARSIEAVARLEDPIGKVIANWKRPNNLKIAKVSVPLGVVAIIYEARPNVTQECASLCLKSGNSVILKGGREAYHSNKAIVDVFKKVLQKHKIPHAAISFVESKDRRSVDELIKCDGYINLVIPRGGEGLIRKVVQGSSIPVIKHYKGICHVYVDKDADLKMAENIAINAKCQRPGVCNAMETLLVHKNIAKKFLPVLAKKLKELSCELRGCSKTKTILKDVKKATEKDWYSEYLDLVLSIKVVDDLNEAVRHIQKYGSAHTDAIITNNKKAASEFVEKVDSSSVMVNTTTRFSDGFQYGLGAEIGISTDKIHARGPMGLDGLTSYKYVVYGRGQLRK